MISLNRRNFPKTGAGAVAINAAGPTVKKGAGGKKPQRKNQCRSHGICRRYHFPARGEKSLH